VAGLAGLAEGHQHAEHLVDLGGSGGAFDAAGKVARGRGRGAAGERGAERDELACGVVARPLDRVGRFGFLDAEGGLGGGATGFLGGLEVWAQPADKAVGFLGTALGVQGDDAGDDFGGGQIGGPAVGGGDGFVQAVVQVAQDGDLAGVVDVAFGVGQCDAGAKFFEGVVEDGQGEVWVCGYAGFSGLCRSGR